MEELLNKLIEKGWKPRGEDKIHSCRYYEEEKKFKADYTIAGIPQVLYRSIRELCSKESGLWQFVCESKLIEQGKTVHDFVIKHICYSDEKRCGGFSMCNAEYYIMMCSLLDESRLEQFLLDNIKI